MFSFKEGVEALQSGISTINNTHNKISNKFSGIDTSDRFDPKTSDDKIAKKTYWSSCSSDRRHSPAYNLVVGDNRLEYKTSASAYILSYGLMFAGAMAFVISIFQFIYQNYGFSSWLPFFGTGIFFMLIGYMLSRSTSESMVFDKSSQLFSKGSGRNFGLNKLYAVQLVSIDISNEHNDSDRDFLDFRSNSTRFYELNIVLKNSKRINLTSHTSYSRTMKDAKIISEFLEIPIWNFADMVVDLKDYQAELMSRV